MKPNLNCEVTRDLLPLYVEQLTSPGTNAAIEEHLGGCPACAALKNELAAPEPPPAADTGREVDYFKKVRKVSRAQAVAAVVGTLLVLAIGAAVKLLWIGTEATREGVSWSGHWMADQVELRVYTNRDGVAYRGWQLIQQDGAARITAQKVTASPLCDDTEELFRIELKDVEEIYLFGTLLWQQGVPVFESTLEAYETRTPYVGSASDVGRVLQALYVGDQCGPFTIALQTGQEPYGLQLNFSETYTAGEAARLNADMADFAVKLLALIENLGEVSWSVPDGNGGTTAYGVTLADADAQFNAVMTALVTAGEFDHVPLTWADEDRKLWPGYGLKWCADTPAGYQILCDLIQDDALNVPWVVRSLRSYPEYTPQAGVVTDDPNTQMAVSAQ